MHYDAPMNTVLWIISVLLVIAGLIGIVLPMLPGTILVFAGLLVAAWADVSERVVGCGRQFGAHGPRSSSTFWRRAQAPSGRGRADRLW
jgi:hypothetical protein